MTNTLAPVALALGGNLGDRLKCLQRAIESLAPYVQVKEVSPVYETAPLYITNQPAYLNAALTGVTRLEPLALLWTIKNIEQEIGRSPSYRYGPRAIDIDIIFYGETVMKTEELTIPHSHLAERAFVLYPLSDIAPRWIHPQTKLSVTEMRATVPADGITCLGKKL